MVCKVLQTRTKTIVFAFGRSLYIIYSYVQDKDFCPRMSEEELAELTSCQSWHFGNIKVLKTFQGISLNAKN